MATSDIGASRKQVPRHASLLVEISKERRSGRRQGEPSCDGGGLTPRSRAEANSWGAPQQRSPLQGHDRNN